MYTNEYTGSVVIPASVTYNGITYSVTSIGDSAFRDCSGLASVVIPDSVEIIGVYAFYNCDGLTSVVIGNSVTSIGNSAFAYCYGLTSVEFNAENCTTMGSSSYPVFGGCAALSSVTIGENVRTIPAYAFWGCVGLTSIVIPNSVTSIGDFAFYYCSSVESLYIGNSIESIGGHVFSFCDNIMEIKIASKKAVAASEDVFSSDTYNNACLYVPEGRKFAYERTTPWNNFYIVEMDFTDIDDVKDENGEVETIYDLNGRAVENPSNGIYIINGKKVLVR